MAFDAFINNDTRKIYTDWNKTKGVRLKSVYRAFETKEQAEIFLGDLKFDKYKIIYTDGSRIKGDYIGWAFYTEGLEFSNSSKNGTNNIAELNAIKSAFDFIKQTKDNYILKTDSKYCVLMIHTLRNYITDAKFKFKKDTKNEELLKEISKIYKHILNRVKVEWVKAHNGEKGNEIADKLAKEAACSLSKFF